MKYCSWDHVTRANPNAKKCGKPAKYQVNGPDGYYVCGIHRRSALAIGEWDMIPLSAGWLIG